MGDGEAKPHAGNGGVYADHAAAAVRERAAGVAGVEGGVCLDDVVDDAARPAGAGRKRAAERGYDPGRDGAAEAVRIADGDHELAHAEPLGIAELGGDEVVALRAKQGEVRERVAADDLEALLAAVAERGAAAGVRSPDHVRIGEQEPVRGEHDRAAGAGRQLPAASAPHDPEAGDRRGKPLRDGDDRPRIRVERLGLLGGGRIGEPGHRAATTPPARRRRSRSPSARRFPGRG
jgi:hypothetical protein